jgi:exosortase
MVELVKGYRVSTHREPAALSGPRDPLDASLHPARSRAWKGADVGNRRHGVTRHWGRVGTPASTAPGWWAAALLAVVLTAVYWEIAVGLVRQWAADDNYTHGFLIPPLALFFAWQQRSALARAPLRPSLWGLAGIGAAAALLVVGTMAAELFLVRLSLVLAIAGAVAFLGGLAHLRTLRFPMAFLLLMIPLPAIVFNQIAFPLQLLASEVGEVTLRAAGVPVLRDGNVLELELVRLEVAEACSGIRSLVSLVTVALIFGRFGGLSGPRLCLLAAATVPIAIAANAARVAGTGLAAHVWGQAVLEGAIHAASGTLVFIVAVSALLALQRAWTPRQMVTP